MKPDPLAQSKSRVLIVEDEAKIASVVKAYLEREGYSVMSAATGQKALGLLKEGFDLMILDLGLPDMDGTEICRAVRENSDMPIIMLTARTAEEDRVGGLGIGADDYVVKPFSPRELAARVNALLRRAKKPSSKPISFNQGALVIDTGRHEVAVDGEQVVLTPTEFKILLALSDRPQAVLSRQQLVTMVQGYDFEGYERTIDAHVKNLRHKIESGARAPGFIKTVYGLGYKFTGVKDED